MQEVPYLSFGTRDYHRYPVKVMRRTHWEFQFVVRGKIASTRRSHASPAASEFLGPALWLHGPGADHGWAGIEGKTAEVAVVHTNTPPLSMAAGSDQAKPAGMNESGAWVLPLRAPDARRYASQIRSVSNDYFNPSPIGQLRLQNVVMQLWLMAAEVFEDLLPHGPQASVASQDVVARALAWYREHLTEAPTVERVAESVRLSASQLRRRFAAAGRTTPLAEMHAIQLESAQQLLIETDEPILDVAMASGFSGASVFSRVFRDQTGTTPRAFRKLHK